MSHPEALEKIFQKLEQESERRAALAHSAQESQAHQLQHQTSFSHLNYDANQPSGTTNNARVRSTTLTSSLSSPPSSERLRSLSSRERLRAAPSSERLRAPASAERLRAVPSVERMNSTSATEKVDSTMSSPTSLSPALTPASPRSEVQSLTFSPTSPAAVPASNENPQRTYGRDRERRRGSISITRFGQPDDQGASAFSTTDPNAPSGVASVNGNGNTVNGTGPAVGFASIYPSNNRARTQSTDTVSSLGSNTSLTHRLESDHITQIQTIAPRASISRSVGEIIARKLSRSRSKASLIGGGGLDGNVVIGVVVEEKTSSASLEVGLDIDHGLPTSPVSPTAPSHHSNGNGSGAGVEGQAAYVRPESRAAVVALHTLNAPPAGKNARGMSLRGTAGLGDKLKKRATVREGKVLKKETSRFAMRRSKSSDREVAKGSVPSVTVRHAENGDDDATIPDNENAEENDDLGTGWVGKAKDLGKKWKRRSTVLFGGNAATSTPPTPTSIAIPVSAPPSVAVSAAPPPS